jgi:hypothetical protein
MNTTIQSTPEVRPRTLRTISILCLTTAALFASPVVGHTQSFPLYVGNQGGTTVEQYNSSGTGSVFASGLNSPAGVAFDLAGNLYVTNRSAGTIEKFAVVGGVLSSTGTVFASSPGGPTGLAFDNAGDLFVTNFGSSANNIMEFTSTGGVLSSTGTVFASTGLNEPQGLAFDGAGNLYVANTLGNNIIKYTSTGGVLSNSGSVFVSPGGAAPLSNPTYMTFDISGDLFVSNNPGGTSGTILKYTSTGGTLSNTASTFASGLSNGLFGEAFDSNGDLFVAVASDNTIEKFTSTGGVLSNTPTTFASSGVSTPYGLAFSQAPEPGSIALLAFGASALLGRRRRRS